MPKSILTERQMIVVIYEYDMYKSNYTTWVDSNWWQRAMAPTGGDGGGQGLPRFF